MCAGVGPGPGLRGGVCTATEVERGVESWRMHRTAQKRLVHQKQCLHDLVLFQASLDKALAQHNVLW